MFLPAWAKEAPAGNRFDHFTGDEEARGRRRGPGKRRDEAGGHRRPERAGAPERQAQRPPERRGGPPHRPPHPRRDDRRPGPPRPVEREPLPRVKVGITIEDKVADSLARQIRATGRSYPIFDLARLILQKNDRFLIRFSVQKNNSGAVEQPLYRCALDETLWTDKEEAAQYLLEKHFDLFYQAERTATTPPKGVYTFVAVCDLNGAVLGPPNYHGYQEELRRLHREQFSRLPFEAFKAKIRIVRDEAVVKKWIEDQSWKTEYLCLNVPEAPRLADRESVGTHFKEVHLPNVLQEVEAHALNGQEALKLPCRGLRQLAWRLMERQRRFPLELVHSLSALFAERKLQFFKLEKDITYVGVARPHYLDLETSIVSDNVRRIIQFIQQNPGSTRQKLMETLAPAPASAPVAEPPAPAEGEGAAPAAPEPTPEQMAIISDLHWLVHQGHVIELANGVLLNAPKPAPKPPPKPPRQPSVPAAESAAPASSAEAGSPAATPAAAGQAEPCSAPVESNLESAAAAETPTPPPAEALPDSQPHDPLAPPEMPAVAEAPAATDALAERAPEPPRDTAATV